MRTSKRLILLFLMGALLIGSLSGCTGKKEDKKADNKTEVNETKEEKLDDYEINLGYYNCDHMVPACIGEATGIFEDMGLNVKITGNGKVPEAMAAGQMDAGYIGNRGMIDANAKGAPIIIGANNHIGGSMYLVVSDNIKKPEDLYGKKVAIGTPSKGEAWLAGYSKKLGLSTKDEDYDLVTISSDADKYVALKTGEIDAFTA